MSAAAPLIAVLTTAAVGLWPRRAAADAMVGALVAAPATAGLDRRQVSETSASSGVDAVAAAVDLLALALRGGVGVVEAIDAVASLSSGAIARQLRTVSAALSWGLEPDDAWATVPPVWQPVARAMVMSAHAGIAPADLLTRAATDLRSAEAQRLQLAATRLGVQVVLPLGLAFLPAFVLTTVLPLVLALGRQALG